jgi:2-iminoacetate synthase ThiH
MSALVDRAILAAGLGPIAEARRGGDLARVSELVPALESCDLLALGALADRVRKEEVGDEVKVFTRGTPSSGPGVFVVHADETEVSKGRGTVLRRVAMARITGPRAGRVVVDWASVGLELAQVALGFGASELAGPVVTRRGLPIADDRTQKVKGVGLVSSQLLKKRELAVLVRMAGREVVFVDGANETRAIPEEGTALEHS